VLVDECVARPLLKQLRGHNFKTAQEMGWGNLRNGKLLALAERSFDAFLTCDQNIEYQQNLKGWKIAVLVLSTNLWPAIKPHGALVQAALDRMRPGQFLKLEIPQR
jgi:hypothetical protein